MNLIESVSDMYDYDMKDDTLELLYEANENIKVVVKSP